MAAGCGKPAGPITWDQDRRVAGAVAPGATLVLMDSGVPAMRPAPVPMRWPDDSTACAATFVAVRGRADTVYAAWRTGKDSTTSVVRVARSANAGIAWDSPVAPAPGEPAPAGCSRPAPGLAVDTVAGAVHVAFHGTANGLTGVFVASLVRPSGRFGAPMIVAVGNRPVPAAVAASADTVAVVFEAPANEAGIMWLAISVGPRHIQAVHDVLSGRGVRAYSPAVVIGAGRVGAAWNEAAHGDQGPAAVARVGRWTR
jgi:hypothetical protein